MYLLSLYTSSYIISSRNLLLRRTFSMCSFFFNKHKYFCHDIDLLNTCDHEVTVVCNSLKWPSNTVRTRLVSQNFSTPNNIINYSSKIVKCYNASILFHCNVLNKVSIDIFVCLLLSIFPLKYQLLVNIIVS